MTNMKKRGLGKGLSDLGLNELLSDIQAVTNTEVINQSELRKLSVDIIQPGKYQPRKNIDPQSIQELADSIRSQGIIQPLVVRSVNQTQYEIIAGERRWRAAQIAGLNEVPVIVRDISDSAAMAMALIENIQREDLNPIDEAMALQRLMNEFAMSHDSVAQVVGKARTTITNMLRLLSLSEEVKNLVQQKQIDMGHARALLALNNSQQGEIAKIVITKNLSVRETEKLIHKIQEPATLKKQILQDPNITALQRDLSNKLGAAVMIAHRSKGNGKLVIQYNSLEELEGIIDHIN